MRTANTETRQQVETLLAKDAYAGALGITVIDAAPGAVRVGMTVRADNLNFLDWAHGGVIFALAGASGVSTYLASRCVVSVVRRAQHMLLARWTPRMRIAVTKRRIHASLTALGGCWRAIAVAGPTPLQPPQRLIGSRLALIRA